MNVDNIQMLALNGNESALEKWGYMWASCCTRLILHIFSKFVPYFDVVFTL